MKCFNSAKFSRNLHAHYRVDYKKITITHIDNIGHGYVSEASTDSDEASETSTELILRMKGGFNLYWATSTGVSPAIQPDNGFKKPTPWTWLQPVPQYTFYTLLRRI
jgi:hypothetical protein